MASSPSNTAQPAPAKDVDDAIWNSFDVEKFRNG